MRVSVLGTLRVTVGGRNITPSAPKLRSLLTILALRHGHMVTTTSLIQELWGDEAPVSSLATLQTYVYHLRKLLTEESAQGAVIITKPLGYVLQLDEKLDCELFDDLVESGRQALEREDPDQADSELTAALGLVSGPPLPDVDGGPMLMTHINEIAEGVLHARVLHVNVSTELGRLDEIVPRLKSLIIEYPFHEDFYAKLMLVLQRAGRRREALDVYRQLRGILVSELGIEPSDELRGIQQRLLSGDALPEQAPAPQRYKASLARPAQLPPDISDFVGRHEQLQRVSTHVTHGATTAVRLVSITGMPGVGKSALAIRAAHSARAQFPDGQFYVSLAGSESDPADPRLVLGRCLRAIGLSDDQIPGSLVERSQLFRSWSAERRVLMVLDDAVSSAQAVPLLPGGAGCCVLVTSRSLLPGLAGACVIELDTPGLDDCISLLADVAGGTRISGDLEAARSIVRLCGHLPLAIRAVGARLRAAPQHTVVGLLTRLANERLRLHELRFEDLDVSARLRPAYGRLDGDARDILHRLVDTREQAFSAASVAALLGTDLLRIERVFERLAQACFLRAMGSDSRSQTLFGVPPFVAMFVQSERLIALSGAADSPAALWFSEAC
jgi:DNA-binding SARP family transcriptional activator